MISKKCAIIGSTPEEFNFGYDEEYPDCVELKAELASGLLELIKEGCGTFITSLEQGAEMWGAEACAAIHTLGGEVRLISVPISETQSNRWHPERRERYFRLLEQSAEVVVPDEGADDYILKNADVILVLGSNPGSRAADIAARAGQQGIPVRHIG